MLFATALENLYGLACPVGRFAWGETVYRLYWPETGEVDAMEESSSSATASDVIRRTSSSSEGSLWYIVVLVRLQVLKLDTSSSDSRRRDWPAIYRSRRSVVRPARLDDVTDWYRGKCAGWWSRYTDCRVMTVDTDWRRSDISHVESLSADRVGRVRHSLPTTQFVSTQTDFQLYNYAAIAHVQRTPSVYLVHNTRDILHYNFAPNINIARRVL